MGARCRKGIYTHIRRIVIVDNWAATAVVDAGGVFTIGFGDAKPSNMKHVMVAAMLIACIAFHSRVLLLNFYQATIIRNDGKTLYLCIRCAEGGVGGLVNLSASPM